MLDLSSRSLLPAVVAIVTSTPSLTSASAIAFTAKLGPPCPGSSEGITCRILIWLPARITYLAFVRLKQLPERPVPIAGEIEECETAGVTADRKLQLSLQ
jgi:hypothetical protein